MGEEQVETKIQRWLETTGFPLEMRVAREARRARPLWMDQSRHFVDPETQKLRETDVVVAFGPRAGKRGAHVILVVECKAKPAPWVVFDDGDLLSDDPELRLYWAAHRTPGTQYGESHDVTIKQNAFTGDTLLRPSRVGFGLVETKFKDWRDDRNTAWGAARSVVTATLALVSEFSTAQIARDQAVLIAFPVVVTSGGLFRSYLDGDSVAVEAVDRAEVVVRTDADGTELRCLVVCEEAWPSLLKDAAETTRVLTLRP